MVALCDLPQEIPLVATSGSIQKQKTKSINIMWSLCQHRLRDSPTSIDGIGSDSSRSTTGGSTDSKEFEIDFTLEHEDEEPKKGFLEYDLRQWRQDVFNYDRT